jgi:crotonobetainyl-CoA:carnitine CoA-transferase CaiB-like acyl-CoA transferase
MGTLDGLSVLDLSRYIAGPTASMMLADQGADVIKVESLPVGDPSRQSGPYDDGHSVYFMSANRNKRSLALNLRDPEALAIVAELAAKADVLIENFKPGTTSAMGIGPDFLAATNPRLVYCSITGFGTGPIGSKMAGFDQNAQGMSGLMSVTGTDDSGPLRAGVPLSDSVTGLVAGFAITAKLLERERTGVGGVVTTSLMEASSFMLTYQAQKFLSLGIVPTRDGNDHPLLFPQGTFRAADGYLTIASGNETMWRKLCHALNLSDLADHPDYSDNERRMANRVALRARMEEQLSAHPAAYWIKFISAAGVPCGEVLDVGSSLEHPVAEELGLSARVQHSALGEMRVLGRPANTGDDKWLRLPPPLLGEHTDEILRGLGYDDDARQRLTATGITRG